MNVRRSQARISRHSGLSIPFHPHRARTRVVRLGLTAGLMALFLVPAVGSGWLQGMAQSPKLPPEVVRVPDAIDQSKINDHQAEKQNFDAANAARKKEIADDSSKLLKLATDLKAEVDKTNKDTLSLSVIRKADAIEKLAHNVKEKMKLSIGPN